VVVSLSAGSGCLSGGLPGYRYKVTPYAGEGSLLLGHSVF